MLCIAVSTARTTHPIKRGSAFWGSEQSQGIAVLMASAVVVLKHETSTLRQRHHFISIDFKFGAGDYVREVTNPDKVARV